MIVEATFRLYPIPACERTWVAAFPATAKGREVVARILASPVVPSTAELLSEAAAREVGERCAATSGLGGVLLAVAVGSLPEAVDAQIRAMRGMAGTRGGDLALEGPAQDAFWAAIRSFDADVAPDMVLKASVLMASVAEAMEAGERLAVERGLAVAIVAEAGTGILRYYVQGGDGGDRMARLADMATRLRTFVAGTKGSLVVLQAPPEVKARVDVWGPAGHGFALMRALKEEFDPGHVLNPGRFVGGL